MGLERFRGSESRTMHPHEYEARNEQIKAEREKCSSYYYYYSFFCFYIIKNIEKNNSARDGQLV